MTSTSSSVYVLHCPLQTHMCTDFECACFRISSQRPCRLARACGAVPVFEDVALTRLLVFISACVWCVCSSRAQRVLGDGLLVIRKVENVLTGPNNKPRVPCIIVECGEM